MMKTEFRIQNTKMGDRRQETVYRSRIRVLANVE